MPVLFDDEEQVVPAPRVQVGGSIAVELDWAMHAAWNARVREQQPPLMRLYADRSDLEDRVRSFWRSDESALWSGAMELTILAHRGGLLFSLDAEALLGRLEELCATGPVDLPLASESEADRAAILRRLERLRSSAEARRSYVDLVIALWSAVGADWRRHGRPAVDAEVAARCQLQRRGVPWQQVARNPYKPDNPLVNRLVGALRPGGVLAVVPAYFSHISGVVDLPGMVLVSVRAEAGGAEARAHTELLARRLKTIADPTRLAMLEVLRTDPSTVTELAEMFSLAQPTVSNHVKLLRDAGLVEVGPHPGRRRLRLRPDALRDVVDHLERMLISDEGSVPAPTAGDGVAAPLS